jgi:ribonuclease HIII
MTTKNEMEVLKQHIRELSQEITSLKKMITPYMTPKEYHEVHSKFLSLSNMKAIAKNELANQLHYYKVTLRGKKNSANGEDQENVYLRKLITEIDCKPYL